jgi:hypothetical protein
MIFICLTTVDFPDSPDPVLVVFCISFVGRASESGHSLPSRRILHSFLNFFESSSIIRSMSAERWDASRSWVADAQLPMATRKY